jgi:hypothetical protein
VLRIVIPSFRHAGQGGFLINVLFMLLYQLGLDDCYLNPTITLSCPRFHLRDWVYLTFDVCHELACGHSSACMAWVFTGASNDPMYLNDNYQN